MRNITTAIVLEVHITPIMTEQVLPFIQTVFGMYTFTTIDGMSVAIYSGTTGCDGDISTNKDGSLMGCGEVFVDVNGANGPNRAGRDFFQFFILKTGQLYPMGLYARFCSYFSGTNIFLSGNPPGHNFYWNGSSNPGCKTGNTAGWECAGRIIDQGWVMDW